MRQKAFLAAACGLFFYAATSCAQPEGSDVDFFQSTLGDIMDTPLLAASYAEERPSDTAATAYVITAETLEKRGYRSLADLLNDTPQFQVQRNSDEGRLNVISVRGIHDNERLLVMYDGVRITPPTGDMFAIAQQLSLADAQRVEVVLGPMSSLYGADAFSGVINVVTRSDNHSRVSAAYGRFDSKNADASAGSRLSSNVPGARLPSASLTYAAASSEGPELPAFYKTDYAWHNGEYQQGLMKTVGSTATATVAPRPYDAREVSSYMNSRVTLGNVDMGFIRMGESHSSSIGVKPEFSQYVKDARFATGYWTVYGRHSYTSPDEAWTLTSLASYYDYELSPETKFLNSFSSYQPAYKYASAQTTSIHELLSFEPAQGYPVLLGLTYQQSTVLPYTADLSRKFDTSKSPVSQGFTYTGSDIPVDFYSLVYSNTGAFIRLQASQLGNVSLSLALRYDRNSTYGETWNPRAGLVWKPGASEDTVVKLLYGEAFLSPSPSDTHRHFGSFVSSPTAASGYHSYFFHIPNEGLAPEKLRSAEASLTHSFGSSLRVSLNPYYTKVYDLIQDVSIGPGLFKGVEVDTLEQPINTGTAETFGTTLRADAVWRAGRCSLEPWASYTLSEARQDGAPMPFNSRHTLLAGLSVLRGRLSVTPKLLYRSYSRNQDGGRVAPFAVADLLIRYACAKLAGLTAYLQFKNIFDRRYYNAAYGAGPDTMAGAPQNPFEATAGLTYKF
ncbi:MAG: TonB-dependent receptor plug domain-containing protein [Elusimicrobiales bacterium]|nr:TonB-dependent receptor plug domain-containing protein [Elusimicrobiales bacterium]